MQRRLDSTTAQLEKLRKHLEVVQYGGSSKTDDSLPQPGTLTSHNPAAAAVRRTTLAATTQMRRARLDIVANAPRHRTPRSY